MSGNVRVPHERGFTVKFSQAIKSIRNGCLAWTDETHTLLRDCTLAEQFEHQVMQSQARAIQDEVLVGSEIGGCKFIRPATTNYRAPREEMLALAAPMMVRQCRWPRQVSA